MKKRVLSMFMALALCLTLLPTAALAEEPPLLRRAQRLRRAEPRK